MYVVNNEKCVQRLDFLAYVDFVFVGATDDVLASDGQRVDTASTMTLENMDTLQCLQLPNLREEMYILLWYSN